MKAFLQKGISLLEVLLSLSIIAIILVLATRYFFVASDTNKVNVTRQTVGSLVAGIEAWKGRNPQYDTISLTDLYNDGYLPKSANIKVSGSPPNATVAGLYDAWGDPITISGSQTGVTINATLPTSADCEALNNSYPNGTCGASGGSSGAFSLTVY